MLHFRVIVNTVSRQRRYEYFVALYASDSVYDHYSLLARFDNSYLIYKYIRGRTASFPPTKQIGTNGMTRINTFYLKGYTGFKKSVFKVVFFWIQHNL